jgi:NADPH-dependent 2,4-dienoyl-CoA reductase/sulfur reductase-like enzyme
MEGDECDDYRDHILPRLLDKEMAEMVKQDLETNGVNIILGEELQEVVTSSSFSSSSQSSLSTSSPKERYLERIRTNKNIEIAIDLLLLGTGVRPNSDIVRLE